MKDNKFVRTEDSPSTSIQLVPGTALNERLKTLANRRRMTRDTIDKRIREIRVKRDQPDRTYGTLVSMSDGPGAVWASWSPETRTITLTTTADAILAPEITTDAFALMANLEHIDGDKLDLSQSRWLADTFYGCDKLTWIDVRGWQPPSNAEGGLRMFDCCAVDPRARHAMPWQNLEMVDKNDHLALYHLHSPLSGTDLAALKSLLVDVTWLSDMDGQALPSSVAEALAFEDWIREDEPTLSEVGWGAPSRGVDIDRVRQ